MLTTDEIEKINHEAKKFPFKKAAAIDALIEVQKSRGYISDEVLIDIANILDMSASELDSIATFYNLIYRKPVGKKVVRVCDSVSCYILGYNKIIKSIKNYLNINLGETTKDNQFTVLPAQCLGTCDKGPAMMINNDLYQNLSEEKVIEILKKYAEEKDDSK